MIYFLKKISNYFPFIADVGAYSLSKFRADAVAALTVAVIALPQSMAYAIIAGVHPKYGLYAAIVPVILAALFGSSRFLIAGPTNAVAMVAASSVSAALAGLATQTFSEADKITVMFSLAFLVGVIQLILGVIKFGSLMNFVSHSVIIGFTAGAGVLIAANQLKNFFGLNIVAGGHFFHTIRAVTENLPHTHWPTFIIGLYTIVLILFLKKVSDKIPGALLAMITAGFIVWILNLDAIGVKVVGDIPRSLPPISYPILNFDYWRALLAPAMAVALLAIVEALSIARSLASQSGDKLNANQELIGQGLGNMGASFFSGIVGTGSFTRSAVNFKSGAQTRFAGVFSALVVLLTVLVFAPVAHYIPIPSLAAIIMVVAYSMIDKKALALSWRANRSDRLVVIITALSALVLELEHAIFFGVIISIILFLRKASVPQVEKVAPREVGGKFLPLSVKHPGLVCPQIGIYQISGSIFFGAAAELEEQVRAIAAQNIKVVIIRMDFVHILDATGVHAFFNLANEMKRLGVTMILSGTRDGVWKVINRTNLIGLIGSDNIFERTSHAVERACQLVDKSICAHCQIRAFRECADK